MNRDLFLPPAQRARRRCSTVLLASCVALALAACGGSGDSTGFNAAPGRTPQPPAAPATPAPPATPLPPSAGAGVSTYASKLEMPGLNRTRGLRIYLPPGYATSGKRYPVIYMHDAQNLFDNAIAQAGEWRVDESMDELAREGALEAIVVGIDRGGEIGKLWEDELRGRELMPFSDNGIAEGKQYMDFIVGVVKPLIDKEYRTLPDRANTALAGASLGGLISYYGINEHPEVFGRAMLFSSSFLAGSSAWPYFFAHTVPPKDARLYFLVGGAEHPSMIAITRDVYQRQLEKGHQPQDVALTVVPAGEHGEPMYRDSFKAAAKWLFAKPVALDPPAPPAPSTAGPGVTVYPTRLAMPGLDRTRGLRIYLPPGYATSGKRYPVIYMHDGQDLFDDATAQAGAGGEWGVDENMDELARSGQFEAIVVGIDRAEGMLREREFIPFQIKTPLLEYQSQGRHYADFVANVVKPLIDREYRTLPERANTAIVGAELGAMISWYTASVHPDKFGHLGLLSPRLDVGTVDGPTWYLSNLPAKDLRMYFMAGADDLEDTKQSAQFFFTELNRENRHNPDASFILGQASGSLRAPLYRAQFKSAVLWMFNKVTPGR